jgi:acyl-CoA dehydrogenase
MSEQRKLLADTVERVFADISAGITQKDLDAIATGNLSAPLWQAIEENGIATVMVPEAEGGFGGDWEDAAVVLRGCGAYGLPLPVPETLLARHLLAKMGADIPEGPIALVAASGLRLDDNGKLWGEACHVPWANAVSRLLVACDNNRLALVDAGTARVTNAGRSVAGEPHADICFENTAVIKSAAVDCDLFAATALVRSAQMAGAIKAALAISVEYANERVQFGKPIGKLQAIQQSLAILADEAAAVDCAALSACRAANRGNANFEIAAAKLRANRSVGPATSVAHQVHGAIGFTREYRLHNHTQRLMAWRSEYGNDRHWARYLGGLVATHGADNFWYDMTTRSDAD